MIVGLIVVGHTSGMGVVDAFLATIFLVVSVALSLAMGVAASYLLVRMVLGAFGSRAAGPVVVERARAAAAGD